MNYEKRIDPYLLISYFCNERVTSFREYFMKKKRKKILENFSLFYLENDRINKWKKKKEKINTNNRSTIWNTLFQKLFTFYLQFQIKAIQSYLFLFTDLE